MTLVYKLSYIVTGAMASCLLFGRLPHASGFVIFGSFAALVLQIVYLVLLYRKSPTRGVLRYLFGIAILLEVVIIINFSTFFSSNIVYDALFGIVFGNIILQRSQWRYFNWGPVGLLLVLCLAYQVFYYICYFMKPQERPKRLINAQARLRRFFRPGKYSPIIGLPADVSGAISKLENAGFEAYAVGQCVRDMMRGVQPKPKEWEICTTATSEQLSDVLGEDYTGIASVCGITFMSDLREELPRREFTINAMAFSPAKGLIDLFGGVDDINSKTIRCVDHPEKCFTDDALCILRALRFASTLGFDVERVTSDAIRDKKRLLQWLAPDVMAPELELLQSGRGASDIMLRYSDVMHIVGSRDA